MIYSNSKRVDSEKMSAEIITLKDRIVGYQDTIHSLRQSLKSAVSTNKKLKITYEDSIAEKDAIIKELTKWKHHLSFLWCYHTMPCQICLQPYLAVHLLPEFV